MIRKPKQQEFVPDMTRQRHLIDMKGAPWYPTWDAANEVLAKIPGGMQMFVVSPEPGKFVPVVCLWPTEFSKDYIAGVQHYGAYAMVGQSFGVPVYDKPKNKKTKIL